MKIHESFDDFLNEDKLNEKKQKLSRAQIISEIEKIIEILEGGYDIGPEILEDLIEKI